MFRGRRVKSSRILLTFPFPSVRLREGKKLRRTNLLKGPLLRVGGPLPPVVVGPVVPLLLVPVAGPGSLEPVVGAAPLLVTDIEGAMGH